MKRAIFLLILMVFSVSACSPYRFFYYPDRRLYLDPAKLNFPYEMQTYPSLNGKELFGLLFRTPSTPKGLIVHFHGNAGNVSSHFLFSHFFTNFGYDVFIFDYQGYGASKGSPSPRRLRKDGIATLRHAKTLIRNEGSLFVLGHSLGGAVALDAMAIEPDGIQGAIIQSTFSSYKSISRHVLKQHFLTWILYPIYPFLLSRRYDPARAIEKITDIPLFFVHGEKDKAIPYQMSERLFNKARTKKQFWLVKEAGHNNIRSVGGDPYEEKLAAFFDSLLSTNQDSEPN